MQFSTLATGSQDRPFTIYVTWDSRNVQYSSHIFVGLKEALNPVSSGDYIFPFPSLVSATTQETPQYRNPRTLMPHP